MIKANDASRRSFVKVTRDSDFPIQNLPFGVAEVNGRKEVVSRIGDKIVLLNSLYEQGAIEGEEGIYKNEYINDLMGQGKYFARKLRNALSDLLLVGSGWTEKTDSFLKDIADVKMCMPVDIGDYTDFYSSKEHATNVGSMFRDPENALLPNWLHLPVGYHGRASSIVVSGTPIYRPMGQTLPKGAEKPIFGPSSLLDFELEMAFVVGKSTTLGERVSVAEAEEYIFGVTLFNDWSARDIQKWEYVPLGPFLAKSFASTISPWIVTLDALEPFRVDSPKQYPEVLPYLKQNGKHSFDIELFVQIDTNSGGTIQACHSNFKNMYWTMSQQLAHHTVNGCNFNIGDMCASGTISGSTKDAFGSMLEITWRGTEPLRFPTGETRKFIEDGDCVTLRGYGKAQDYRIGFGECASEVLEARGFELG